MPRPPLLDGHVQREFQRRRYPIGFVRIDQQRAVELFGGAGEFGQYQDAGIVRILNGDIGLATRFIPSRKGVTIPTSAAR